MTFNEQRQIWFERHENFLNIQLQTRDIPCEKLRQAMAYSLLSNGKRIRPLLTYLSGEFLNVPVHVCDVIAGAIECIHAYSLIHDDLPAMDNDDMRRGKPTCHRAFDEATAILAGDALQGLAFDILLTGLKNHIADHHIIQVALILSNASGASGMISGQSLDLTWLNTSSFEESLLKEIHLLKTGKLIEASVNMVTILSNESDELTHMLTQYAQTLGLLFQMQDDYLDAFAPPTYLGKNRASDKAQGKKTFAHFYDKETLHDLIQDMFSILHHILSPFKERANHLIAFTETIEARMVEN